MLHGAVGAGMSAMRGGDVGLGFFSAMIPGAFAGEINGIGGSDQFGVFARTMVSGVIGGAVAAAGSGNFWDGFQTAAFARLLNDENQVIRKHLTLSEANKHYREGSGKALTIDASKLSVKRITSWRNGKALGRVQGSEFLVHGTVTLQMGANGLISIKEGLYNFDVKSWEGNVMRNIETIAAHVYAGSGTPYMIYYSGTPNVTQ